MFIENTISKAAAKFAKQTGAPINRHAMAVEIHHNSCALLFFSQIMLYSTLVGMPLAGPAQWWLTLFQFFPAAALFFGMRLVLKLNPGQNLMGAFEKSLGRVGTAIAVGIYGLLLLLDAWFTLHALTDIVAAYVVKMPSYSMIGMAAVGTCLVAVLTGGTDGSSQMVYLFTKPLMLLLFIAVLASFQMGGLSNLYPYLGPGSQSALASGLQGCGAAWPVVLMGFVPQEPNAPMPWQSQKPTGFKWLPYTILSVIWPLFSYCFVQPYDSLMAASTWSARIVGFLRSSPSKLIWELFLIRAMLVFTCGICSSVSFFSYITSEGLLKKAKRAFLAIAFSGVLMVLANYHYDSMLDLFAKIMPWRFPAALLPLLAATLLSFIRNRSRIKKVTA